MGARPEEQLTLNFLRAVHTLWVEYPGTYAVKESVDDLVPALAQMCIKALAADIRDLIPKEEQLEIVVEGRIVSINGNEKRIDLRDVVNKVIHGTPTSVVVKDKIVYLHFRNNKHVGWAEAWFSGTELLQVLDHKLHKHPSEDREYMITQFLQNLGERWFLPSATSESFEM